MADLPFDDAAYERATRRGAVERATSPKPKSVRFDPASGRIVVEFANGAAFMVPARSLEGLRDASNDELANVTLLGETGLHWDSLDVDYSINGLMSGIFGSARFMETLRRGGMSRSEAKVAASRANGAKGGRPRKAEP